VACPCLRWAQISRHRAGGLRLISPATSAEPGGCGALMLHIDLEPRKRRPQS
jgi:hypothetical protein